MILANKNSINMSTMNLRCLTVLKIEYVLSIFMYNGVIWNFFS